MSLESFIFEHFTGPIKADALGHPVTEHGIIATENYTLISEIVYGLIIVLSIYGIYKLLKNFNTKWFDFTSKEFFVSIFFLVVFGSSLRVIEDAGVIDLPYAYLCVSPIIYFFILSIFLVLLYISRRLGSLYPLLYSSIFLGGLTFLYCIFEIYPLDFGYELLGTIFLSIGIGFIFTALVFRRRHGEFNLDLIFFVIFAHLFDAFTGWFATAVYYSEKHPLSAFFLENLGIGFVAVKLLGIAFIIYLIIKYQKQNLLMGHYLFYILFIAGFAPGLRDFLRTLGGV